MYNLKYFAKIIKPPVGFFGVLGGVLLLSGCVSIPAPEVINETSATTTKTNSPPTFTKKNFINLSVPFTSEAPEGKWVDPWFNGCEEASVVMVDQFYLGKTSLRKTEAKNLMQQIFDWELKTFGQDTDTNATETNRIINEFTSFLATIKRNPTIEEIKAELVAQRPVIALIDGVKFYGKNYGNGYHMVVLKGYDDKTQEFIMHDTGSNVRGANFRKSYALIMGALTDFDHDTKKIGGPATVLFTRAKK